MAGYVYSELRENEVQLTVSRKAEGRFGTWDKMSKIEEKSTKTGGFYDLILVLDRILSVKCNNYLS